MKKIIKIKIKLILVLILFNCYCLTSLALVKPVTKASLTDAYNEYAKGYSGSYTSETGGLGFVSFGESKPIEVTDSQLIDKTDERKPIYIEYSLGDTPKFWTKVELNSESDISAAKDLKEILEKPVIGLLGIIISQDVPMGDAYNYYSDVDDIKVLKYNNSYSSSVIMNQLSITLDEETKTYEKGKVNYDELVPFLLEENKVIKDDKKGIYTYTVGYKKNSKNNYTIEATLEINKDADFSKIGKTTNTNNNNGSSNNNSNNTTNNVLNNTAKTNTVSENDNKNNTNNTNTNVAKKEEFPKTGVDNTVLLMITFLCVISISLAIRIITFKDIK